MSIPSLVCGLIKNPIEQSICQNVLTNPCPFVFSKNKKAQKECEETLNAVETGKIFDVYEKIENAFKTIITLNFIILLLVIIVVIILLVHVFYKRK